MRGLPRSTRPWLLATSRPSGLYLLGEHDDHDAHHCGRGQQLTGRRYTTYYQ